MLCKALTYPASHSGPVCIKDAIQDKATLNSWKCKWKDMGFIKTLSPATAPPFFNSSGWNRGASNWVLESCRFSYLSFIKVPVTQTMKKCHWVWVQRLTPWTLSQTWRCHCSLRWWAGGRGHAIFCAGLCFPLLPNGGNKNVSEMWWFIKYF